MADTISGDKVTQIVDAFNGVADGKGLVATKMLGTLMKSMGENPSKEEIQDMINEVDKDGVGTIRFPAFLTMMASKFDLLVAEDEIRQAFCVFDVVRSKIKDPS